MKNRSRTEYSVLNIIAGVGGYIVNTILGFICRMVFVKCLAADYLGVNGLFTNILSMLSLAELGIGGAIIYNLLMPYCKKMYVTQLDKDFEGDAFFPTIDHEIWKETSRVHGIKNEQNNLDYDFVEYERI